MQTTTSTSPETFSSTEPNSYEAHGTIALKNLGVFNELLRSLGQPGDLAGALEVDLSGKGTVKESNSRIDRSWATN